MFRKLSVMGGGPEAGKGRAWGPRLHLLAFSLADMSSYGLQLGKERNMLRLTFQRDF